MLDESGSPVSGLYAAGGAAQGGMLLKGHGLHIAWAMTSGRIAGETAARQLPVEAAEGAAVAASPAAAAGGDPAGGLVPAQGEIRT